MRSASFTAIAVTIMLAAPSHAAPSAAIKAAVANPARLESEKPRDHYRHPAETLSFFGVTPGQTVIEFSPGGGWYTRILMPLLAKSGHYVAVVSTSLQSQDNAKKLVASLPGAAKATVSAFDPATATMAKSGSADVVLTFRNVHNLLMPEDGGAKDGSVARAFFRAAYKALKPGGVLGVVDHRGRTDMSQEAQMRFGYVREDVAIKLIEKAGFKLAAKSEVNANPKDTKDYPDGVWTLPPSFRLGDKDRARYQAIGESDRFTHKFVKY